MIELPMASPSQQSSAASSAHGRASSDQKTETENGTPFETAYKVARDDSQSENTDARDSDVAEQEGNASPEGLAREVNPDAEVDASEHLSASVEVVTSDPGEIPEFGLREGARKTVEGDNNPLTKPELSTRTPPQIAGEGKDKPVENLQNISQANALQNPKPENVAAINVPTAAENAVMSKVKSSIENAAVTQSTPAKSSLKTSDDAPALFTAPRPDGSHAKMPGKDEIKASVVTANEPHPRTPHPSDEPRNADLRSTVWAQRPETQNVPGTVAASVPPPKPILQATKLQLAEDKMPPMRLDAVEPDSLLQFDTRGTAPVTSSGSAQIFARPETPAMIARQMAEVLQQAADRPVEVSLNPRELGRVRMNISAVEAGITVSVVAERPETLDLMRRNIDQLVKEFEALGYNNINFAFAEGEARQDFGKGDGDPENKAPTRLHLDTVPADDVPQIARVVSSGVDIRL